MSSDQDCASCGNSLEEALIMSCEHNLCLPCASRSMSHGNSILCSKCGERTELDEESVEQLKLLRRSTGESSFTNSRPQTVSQNNFGFGNGSGFTRNEDFKFPEMSSERMNSNPERNNVEKFPGSERNPRNLSPRPTSFEQRLSQFPAISATLARGSSTPLAPPLHPRPHQQQQVQQHQTHQSHALQYQPSQQHQHQYTHPPLPHHHQHSQFTQPPTPSIPRDTTDTGNCGNCETQNASVKCVQCAESFCSECARNFHSKGRFSQHTLVPIGNHSIQRSRPVSQGDAVSDVSYYSMTPLRQGQATPSVMSRVSGTPRLHFQGFNTSSPGMSAVAPVLRAGLPCADHPEELVQYFCLVCDDAKAVCAECVFRGTKHHSHLAEVLPLKKAFVSMRARIESVHGSLEGCIRSLGSAQKDLHDSANTLAAVAEQAKLQMKRGFDELREQIRMKEIEMNRKIDDVVVSETKVMNEDADSIMTKQTRLEELSSALANHVSNNDELSALNVYAEAKTVLSKEIMDIKPAPKMHVSPDLAIKHTELVNSLHAAISDMPGLIPSMKQAVESKPRHNRQHEQDKHVPTATHTVPQQSVLSSRPVTRQVEHVQAIPQFAANSPTSRTSPKKGRENRTGQVTEKKVMRSDATLIRAVSSAFEEPLSPQNIAILGNKSRYVQN